MRRASHLCAPACWRCVCERRATRRCSVFGCVDRACSIEYIIIIIQSSQTNASTRRAQITGLPSQTEPRTAAVAALMTMIAMLMPQRRNDFRAMHRARYKCIDGSSIRPLFGCGCTSRRTRRTMIMIRIIRRRRAAAIIIMCTPRAGACRTCSATYPCMSACDQLCIHQFVDLCSTVCENMRNLSTIVVRHTRHAQTEHYNFVWHPTTPALYCCRFF